jgi:uncharacterized RDD family membrane protein YckC
MSTSTGPGPAATGAQQSGGPSGPRAGFGSRLGAAIIDGLVLAIPLWILLVVAPDAAGVIYLVYLVASIAYFTILEGGASGQTLGKRALGIRVYDLRQGGPIGPGRAFIRWIGRYVSTLVIFLGYLWMLWDPEKQTWHDKLAGSVVVPTSQYPV